MCRAELPPVPEPLLEEVGRRYVAIERVVGSGKATWGTLAKAQQKEMNCAIDLLLSAADQGHLKYQSNLGILYANGRG